MIDGKMTKRDLHIADRTERLRKELEQLNAEAKAREARRRATAAKKQRADDTRRDILIGACVRVNSGVNAELMRQLDAFLERDNDRALFGFEPKPKPEPKPEPTAFIPTLSVPTEFVRK